MTQQEITDNNKLIAELVGMQQTDIGWYDHEGILNDYVYTNECGNTMDELRFNDSWDWLMPVVASIYNIGVDEDTNNNIGDITHALIDVDIDKVYYAVVTFIKWHNQHK